MVTVSGASPYSYQTIYGHKIFIKLNENIETIMNAFFGENYYLNKLRVPMVAYRLPTNFLHKIF
jgi:hypothetical protein